MIHLLLPVENMKRMLQNLEEILPQYHMHSDVLIDSNLQPHNSTLPVLYVYVYVIKINCLIIKNLLLDTKNITILKTD